MKSEYIIAIAIGVWILIYAIAIAPIMSVWTKAWMSGAPIPFIRMFGMRLKKINLVNLVDAHIKATQAEANISLEELEKHCLAGGNVSKVVPLYIQVINRKIKIPFSVICETDLAGIDLDGIDPERFREYNELTNQVTLRDAATD